jgi:hypothetical protein
MGTLALPGVTLKVFQGFPKHYLCVIVGRPVTASLFTKCQCHNTLSANVEIGVPRCSTQSRQPYYLSPITYNAPLPHPSDPTDPTDPSDSPEITDPFKSLTCLKTYPRHLPMWKLAFPGVTLKVFQGFSRHFVRRQVLESVVASPIEIKHLRWTATQTSSKR